MTQAPIERHCPSCGATVADTPKCAACGVELSPVASGKWLHIEAQLICRVCGLLSALAPLHDGSEVTCSQCGKRQVFNPRVWKLAFDRIRSAPPASIESRTVEVATEDALPRRDGTSIRVEYASQQPSGSQGGTPPPATLAALIPEMRAVTVSSGDPFRGFRPAAWVLLDLPEVPAPTLSEAEEAKDEPRRDSFGFKVNSALVTAEILLVVAAGALTGRLRTMRFEFWVVLVVGGLLNGVWGWAGLSLAQKPSEKDVWVYYLIVLAPQAVMVGLATAILTGH